MSINHAITPFQQRDLHSMEIQLSVEAYSGSNQTSKTELFSQKASS